MKTTQPHLSYLIFILFFLMSFRSWAAFDIASSSHTDITCNNIDEGTTNDGTITLTFDAASAAEGKTIVWWKHNGTAFVALAGGTIVEIANPTTVGKVGASSIKAINLGVGSYFAVVTGALGEVEASATFSITKPDAISLLINDSYTIDPLCNGGATGQISAAAYGGQGTYSYAISTSNGSYTYNDPDGIFTGLSDASNPTYHFSVQATDGSNVCTYDYASGGTLSGTDITETLTEPDALVFGGPSPVTATDVVCFGESNGTITVAGASGGIGGTGVTTGLSYGYIESTTASGTPAASAFSFSENSDTGGITFTGVNENTASTESYYIAVQDANGCVTPFGSPVRINSPAADIAISSFTRDNPSDLSGIDGSIDVTGVSGGNSSSYSFNWINASNTQWSTTEDLDPTTVIVTATGVPAGIYTLTVTDAKSCEKTFTQQTLTDCFDVAETLVNLSGFELGDGSISLLPVTDNSSATYTWGAIWKSATATAAVNGAISGVNTLVVDAITGSTSSATAAVNIVYPTANVNGATASITTLAINGNAGGNIEVGDVVTGTGISGIVTVASVADQNNLILSSPQTLTNGIALTFTHSPRTSTSMAIDNLTGTLSGGEIVTGNDVVGFVTVIAVSGSTITLSSAQTLSDNMSLTFYPSGAINNGDIVTGTGIVGVVTVSGVSGTTITLSSNQTLANNVDLTFSGQAVTPSATASTANVNGTTASTTTLAVNGNAGGNIEVGDVVTGTGISGIVTVVTVIDQNNLILSSPQTLTNSIALTFTPLNIKTLGANTYAAIITGSTGGGACTQAIEYVITQPDEFSIASSTTPKSISGDANDIICMDTNDAYITVVANGGTSPYKIQYKYSTDGVTYSTRYGTNTTTTFTDDLSYINGLNLSNLPAGYYKIRLQDYNSTNTDDVIVEITEPSTGFSMPIVAATASVNGAISAPTTNLVVDNNVGTILVGDIITGKQTDRSDFRAIVQTVTDQQNLVVTAATAISSLEDNTVLTFTHENPSTSTAPRTLSLTDVSCNTLDDGKAEFDPITGHTIDSIRWYKWTGSTKTKLDNYDDLTSIDTLVEGSYTLEIGDPFGCLQSTNFAINEPEVLSLDETITNVVCPASSTADVATSSGDMILLLTSNLGTIALGDVVTGTGISGHVTVTAINDQNDITVSANVTASGNLTFAPPGIVSVVVGGATSNSLNSEFYTYTWDQGGILMPTSQVDNTGGTSNTQLTVTEAGNYTLTITDFNNCTYTTETIQFQKSFPVNVPDVMTVALTTVSGVSAYGIDSTNVSHPFCKDGDDGYILIDVAGGTPNPTYGYRYSWYKNSATTVMASSQDVSGLDNGNYDVIVTDGNGCTLNSPDYTIASPTSSYHIEDLSTITPTVLTNPTCNGETGSIAIEIDDDDDGTHPSGYTYDWFTGQAATGTAFNTTNTKTVSNLNAAYYTFQVTDYYGCRQTETFRVEESPTIVITSDITQLTCPSSVDAQIEIEASGGNSVLATDYIYSWKKDGDPFVITAPATVTDLVNLDSGIYIITVSDQATTAPDKAACVATDTLQVNYLAGFQVTEVITPAACQAGGTSEISVVLSGGTAPYTQQWKTTPGAVFVGNGTTIADLDDDTYRLIITDNNNCNSTAGDFDYVVAAPTTSYSINAPTTISETVTASATATVISPVTCNGENSGYIEVKLTADVGHPTDYTYAWFAGQTATGAVLDSVKVISGLGAGYYTFQATDANGCVREATYEITEYSAMQISSTVSDNVCGGDQIASIDIEANGGNSLNYAYQWSKNGVAFNPADSSWTDTEISTLASGIYKVILTDEQGCDFEKSFEISDIPLLAVDTTLTHVVCKDGATGKIELDISGGNAPYTVTWSKSNAFVDDTPTVSDLTVGIYRLTVVDSLNCPSLEKDVEIKEPLTAYAIDPLGTVPTCFEAADGLININVTEDVGHPTTYQLDWRKDGELLYANEEESITFLNGGFYEFSITDEYGCKRSDTLTLIEPNDIYLHPFIDTLECYNASNAIITLDPTGGSDLYPSILWQYNGSTTSDIAFEASYLASGNHSIRITDSKGCIKDSTIVIDNPANMAVDPTIANVLCKDASTGTISVAMINGQPNYSYAWVANNKVFSTSNAIDSLASGDYFLAVQDDYLCLSDTFTINVAEPNNRFNINGDISRISCRDSSDAKILVSIEILGESTDFTYAWEKDDLPISESRDQVDISPGTYTIGVTDNFGCLRSNTFTLENPDAVNVTSTQENVLCYGDSTGLIALSPTGGWGNFSYEWERNLVSLPISESFGNTLPVGDYIIDVIDDGLCVTPVYITLSAPDTINFNAINSNLTCYGQRDGAISVSVTGGVPEYTYNWAKDGDPYSQDINLSRLGTGNYELIVTDGSLCEYSSGILEITEPDILSLDVLSFNNNLCTTTNNGAFAVEARGGTGDYLYQLNDGDPFPNGDYDGLVGGNQNIKITDDNLCIFDTILVVDTDYLLVSAFNWDYEYPYIDWPISFFDASLGPDIVNWSWDLGNGALTNDVNSGFTYVSPGSYPITLKITNIVGCEAVTTEVLNIEKGFRVTMPSAFTPNLDGLNDYFRPTLENVISMHLIVYNKYGSVVFETRDLDGEWDGSLNFVPLPQDSYLYEITYVAESGVSRTSRGKVAMLR